MNFSGLFKLEV